MFIYFFVFLLILICVYTFDIKGKQINRGFWEIVIVVVLILLAGLRNHVGSDSIAYEYTFNHSTPLLHDFLSIRDLNSIREPLWALLMSLCKTVFGSFVFFQFVHAIILNTLLFRFYKKLTDKTFTALLITFLVSWIGLNFEILRQSLCIAIYLNAILLLKDNKITSYILLSILMFGIHNFSVVLSIISPIILFVNKKWLYPTLLLAALFVIFFVDVTFLNMMFLETEDFRNSFMQRQIDAYTNHDIYGYVNLNMNGIIRLTVLYVLFPLSLFRLNKDNYLSSVKKQKITLNIYIIQIEEFLNSFILLYMVFGLLSSKMVIFFRFQQYILPFVVVSSVIVFYKKQKKSLQTACFFFYLLFMIFTIDAVVTLYNPSSSNSLESYDTRYFPYTSVFQEPDPLREKMWGK